MSNSQFSQIFNSNVSKTRRKWQQKNNSVWHIGSHVSFWHNIHVGITPCQRVCCFYQQLLILAISMDRKSTLISKHLTCYGVSDSGVSDGYTSMGITYRYFILQVLRSCGTSSQKTPFCSERQLRSKIMNEQNKRQRRLHKVLDSMTQNY